MNDRKRTQGIVYAVLSAIAFGHLPIFATYAYRSGANAVTVVLLRFLFSTIILLGYLIVRNIDFKVDGYMLKRLIFSGVVGCASTALTLFLSYKYISVGLATILHFIYPAVVTLLSYLVFKESLNRSKVIALLLSIAGVYILVGFNSIKLHPIGVILALISGVFYSIYILQIGYTQIKNIDSTVLIFYVSLFSTIGIFIYGIFTKTLYFKIQQDFVISIAAIVLTSIFALFTFTGAIKNIGSSNASILSTFEPITSIMLSSIMFNEKLTYNIIIGSILIIISIYGIVKKPVDPNSMYKVSNRKAS